MIVVYIRLGNKEVYSARSTLSVEYYANSDEESGRPLMRNCASRPRVVCEETAVFLILLQPGERKQSSLFPMWVKRLGTLFWFRPLWECATRETGMCVREEANIATGIVDVIVLV